MSASPERIVLKKSVDGADFPFDETALRGKAILIHPVSGKAEEGVYARAVDVKTENDQYAIGAKPLTLEEMGKIVENDIVRIYINTKQSVHKGTDGPTLVAEPLSLSAGGISPALSPLSLGAIGNAFNAFNFGGYDFASPVFLAPGITYKHTVDKASVTPELLADWSSESGLELGFRGEMDWRSKIVVSGKLSGEFFHSQTFASPSVTIYVPIGPVPVPVSINAEAFVACSASVTDLAELTLDIDVGAKLAASFRVSPTTDSAPSSWVTAGSWPAEASGHADVTPSSSAGWGTTTLSCMLPHLQLNARVAGIAGPYLAITPSATLNDKGATMAASIAAGVSAGALGFSSAAEVNLYTWKP